MTTMIRKLIGYCCEQEMVEAANKELAELLSLRDENDQLRMALKSIETCAGNNCKTCFAIARQWSEDRSPRAKDQRVK